jgi:hypothetical protein
MFMHVLQKNAGKDYERFHEVPYTDSEPLKVLSLFRSLWAVCNACVHAWSSMPQASEILECLYLCIGTFLHAVHVWL